MSEEVTEARDEALLEVLEIEMERFLAYMERERKEREKRWMRLRVARRRMSAR